MERIKILVLCLITLALFSPYALASDADSLNMAGVKLADQGELDQALIKFREAVELDPKHAKAQFNLGEAAYDLKQWDAAQHAYESYLALNQGSQEEKDSLIKRLVLLRKDHGEAPPAATMKVIDAARKDLEAKKLDAAEKSLKTAQKASPWVLESTQELAFLYAYKGDKNDALEQVSLFSKYAASSSDTERLKSKVDDILAQKKTTEESKTEADKAQSESEGFMKHGGISLSGLYGFGVLGNTASDDGNKKYTYKDVFSGTRGLDLNVFFANPDRLMLYRLGYVYEKFIATAGAPNLAVTPAGLSSNASVQPTDVTSHTAYLGIGFTWEYFYIAGDIGLTQLSSSKLEAPVKHLSATIPHVPTNTGPILYGALSVGAHVPISAYFSLALEGRIGGPVGRAFYHRGPDEATNSVPLAEWISSNKILAGLIYRF